MLSIILSACFLVAVTMWMHAAGIAVLVRGLNRSHALAPTGVWPITRKLLRMIWWLILLHLAEVSVWAFFYSWRGCVPNAEAAFYYSGITYTTVGYGDLVLAKPWRLLGPLRELDGRPHVRLVHGLFLRSGELHPSIAAGERHCRLRYGESTTVKTVPSVRCEIG